MRVACLLGMVAVPLMLSGAYAAAWTQEAGKGKVIVTGSYYESPKIFNNNGDKQTAPNFHKYELNPYVEYGLYDDVTLGASFSLQRAQQNVPGASDDSNMGIGESEFFGRYRFYQKDGVVASVQPFFKLPPPATDERPPLGSPNADIGLGGSVGYSMSVFGYQDFMNLDAQYRHRFGHQRDQIRFAATVGVGVAPDWMVMPQAFMTLRTSDPGVTAVTQTNADDYSVTRLQLSGVYSVSDDTKLQAGAFSDVAGKNAGVGRGMLLSVWQNF